MSGGVAEVSGAIPSPRADRATHGYTTKSTLETLRCRGGGPAFIKIRGKVYYRQTSLDQWIDDNSIECQNTSCYQTLTAPP